MNIFEEISGLTGLDIVANGNVNVYCLGGKVVFVQGYKKILDFSDNEILLLAKREKIVISGSDLIVNALEKNELVVSGIIEDIKFKVK